VTQFGRALTELNIEIICANSPQAKGRVERMNKTQGYKVIALPGLRIWIEDYSLKPAGEE
jgi:hypothetical protein